jgi:hypothetical protein
MSLDIWLTVDVDTGGTVPHRVELYSANITHNVNDMWMEAGVYDALYNSEGDEAGKHLQVLAKGIKDMSENPEKYEAMDSPNGWGSYKHALPWLQKWYVACYSHPKAIIGIWK